MSWDPPSPRLQIRHPRTGTGHVCKSNQTPSVVHCCHLQAPSPGWHLCNAAAAAKSVCCCETQHFRSSVSQPAVSGVVKPTAAARNRVREPARVQHAPSAQRSMHSAACTLPHGAVNVPLGLLHTCCTDTTGRRARGRCQTTERRAHAGDNTYRRAGRRWVQNPAG